MLVYVFHLACSQQVYEHYLLIGLITRIMEMSELIFEEMIEVSEWIYQHYLA